MKNEKPIKVCVWRCILDFIYTKSKIPQNIQNKNWINYGTHIVECYILIKSEIVASIYGYGKY